MRGKYLCLLTVAILIVSVLIAGCATSNLTNPSPSQEANTNTSTSSTNTTTTTSTTATVTPTASPSPSVSPSPNASPSPSVSPTATPTPSVSGKISTTIQFTSDPSVKVGQSLGINVISSTSGIRICAPGLVTATIGSVTSVSDCYHTANLDTSSLNPGTYNVTLKFAGDSTYQPSQSTLKITVTA